MHAQDRLWQMELQRRTGQGRLSEIFGERTFSTDVFLRTLDLYGHAERSLAALPDDAKRALEAYARGVNAFIDAPHRAGSSRGCRPSSCCCGIGPSHGSRPTAWSPSS